MHAIRNMIGKASQIIQKLIPGKRAISGLFSTIKTWGSLIRLKPVDDSIKDEVIIFNRNGRVFQVDVASRATPEDLDKYRRSLAKENTRL